MNVNVNTLSISNSIPFKTSGTSTVQHVDLILAHNFGLDSRFRLEWQIDSTRHHLRLHMFENERTTIRGILLRLFYASRRFVDGEKIGGFASPRVGVGEWKGLMFHGEALRSKNWVFCWE